MFINKMNQLFKPKRRLYYSETTIEELREVNAGRFPERVAKYTNAFGTYDYPGVFMCPPFELPVLGIEYRPDDPRIDYPKDLEYIDVDAHFFYAVEMDNEIEMSPESVKSIFDKMALDNDAHRLYTDFTFKDHSDYISIFADDKKIRILYEINLDSIECKDVMNDNVEKFEKDYLYRLAFREPITGHYNWNHLGPFLEAPNEYGITDYAFVHFDIKEFRIINEVYGHSIANTILCDIVRAMNESDFVYTSCRCHNDNFAMLIKDMPHDEMRHKLEDFFEGISRISEDPKYKIYYRAGVVPMQRSMLAGNRVADAAKLAQSLGKSHYKTDITFYSDRMHDDVLWGNYIKAYLDTAIENDEFVVYLQPKFDLGTEEIRGAEALVRWNYKSTDFMPPSRFIPFFEKDGSIGKVDDIVLSKVCAALKKWKDEGRKLYPISVNLSRERIYESGLIDHLTSIVDSYGVDHKLIDFELTENATYEDTDYLMSLLRQLRDRGFVISMDDFGTGYSSFSLLTEMPLDILKIDKSFIDKVGTDIESDKDITVIKHIITLAKELDFKCLAEGAETRNQVDRLKVLGCEIVQGYYYSKPIAISEYEEKYL
ncbi:MAG: EAL domain-containing protein [Lachnospiraceae bacterium]|nr:EAL domain-containing protein [Lachnospiraceae bacterium]